MTPGTLIEDSMLSPHAPNFLLAIVPPSQSASDLVGIACIDVSTGQLFLSATPIESLGSFACVVVLCIFQLLYFRGLRNRTYMYEIRGRDKSNTTARDFNVISCKCCHPPLGFVGAVDFFSSGPLVAD